MTSKATRQFWDRYRRLPTEIQSLAAQKYQTWQRDPFHPSLHFKEIRAGLWSVRINLNYRALARRSGDLIAWFWIGTHAEYNKLLM